MNLTLPAVIGHWGSLREPFGRAIAWIARRRVSGGATTRRLKQVDQLCELSLSLMRAKKLSDEKAEAYKQKAAKETKKEI